MLSLHVVAGNLARALDARVEQLGSRFWGCKLEFQENSEYFRCTPTILGQGARLLALGLVFDYWGIRFLCAAAGPCRSGASNGMSCKARLFQNP